MCVAGYLLPFSKHCSGLPLEIVTLMGEPYLLRVLHMCTHSPSGVTAQMSSSFFNTLEPTNSKIL